MAIYQQFRLIWRRQPQQDAPFMLPLPDIMFQKTLSELGMPVNHSATGVAAAAA